MIIGTGIDIVEISRISSALTRPAFLKRYFTDGEIALFEFRKSPEQSVAANFAAKEAFAKALGSGFRGFGAEEIEVLRDENGKPFINLYGRAKAAAAAAGAEYIHVSLSHSGDNAAAVVILEGCGV